MKQIFVIFLKDVRHLWPEILASLAVVAALVLVYPRGWRSSEIMNMGRIGLFARYGGDADVAASILVLLVPLSWFILVARLVHSERLVGNTQFWLTRPYEWPKFLAAKLLFLASFVYAPFVLGQCILLAEGGFQPLAYLPGLFFNLFCVTFILVLPFFALSAATPSFGKLTLVALAVLLSIAGVAIGYSALPYDLTFSGADWLSDLLSALFITCGCAAIVLVQYARRGTRLSWILIGVTGLLMATLTFVDPDRWFMGHYYPAQASGAAAPLQVSLANIPVLRRAYESADTGDVEFGIPLQVAGIPEGATVEPVAVRASIQASGGAQWQTQWKADSGMNIMREIPITVVHLRMRRSLYDQFKSAPVTLHLALAVDEAKVATTGQLPLRIEDFSIPGVGVCKGPPPTPYSTGFIHCRSAMRQPPLTYVIGHWTEGDCPAQPTDDGTILGAAWVGNLDQHPAEFGITSVWQFPISLSNVMWGRGPGAVNVGPPHLCPGTTLTFTTYRLASSEQLSVTIPNFQLPELENVRIGGFAR
ncbi:MAG: hypothetical protein WBA18_07265 [Terracidiphilus sp.]